MNSITQYKLELKSIISEIQIKEKHIKDDTSVVVLTWNLFRLHQGILNNQVLMQDDVAIIDRE